MLFRFCLYGFLKNQQYYDPFLILVFRHRGLSFAEIGLLIGFREICINLLEVPTGAIADVLGRRRSMVASMLAYIAAFVIFSGAWRLWVLFGAMAFFAAGEALRTGTHKAIIFDWLDQQGRAGEKTHVYGLTRSWSKLGSALSVIIAAVIVCFTEDYSAVFLLCLAPYVLNAFNLLSYPAYLDGPRSGHASVGAIVRTLLAALGESLRRRRLRGVLIESMGFDGLYRSVKDYIQPIIMAAALAAPLLLGLDDRRRTAMLIGAVYFLLHVLSSAASRRAGRLSDRAGGDERAARWLWLADLAGFALLAGGALAGLPALMIGAFVMLAVIQNFWRPILVSRCASLSDPSRTATVLSIESQAKCLFVAIVAPLLGWSVDLIATATADGPGYMASWRFLPIAAIGVAIPLGMLIVARRNATAGEDLPG